MRSLEPLAAALSLLLGAPGLAQEPSHAPALPDGMTLDEVLDAAAKPPPESFPSAVHDHKVLVFVFFEQLEYRWDGSSDPDVIGLDAMSWVGGDFNRLTLKAEGETTFSGSRSLELETDVLYSRLISPFWSAQIGIQYANEWTSKAYEDRWSAALAIQGMAPGRFEVDASFYISERADIVASLELEYDWRLSQRLVLQPRTELSFAFQEIPERDIGLGLTGIVAGLRLRYEFLREFAPYVGVRYEGLVFETADLARAAGEPTWRVFASGGVRFAFL